MDADIGVVNPKRRIEEFIDPKFDIIFYDRFYNQEIATGAYIVKNSQWSQDFLNNFADYELKLPQSFHGTDNGALHAYVAEIMFPHRKVELANCLRIYNRSRDFDDLFVFETCIRTMIGVGTDFEHIRIMKKGRGWVRDAWLTNSLWNDNIDFMLHGWKDTQLSKYGDADLPITIYEKSRGMWYNPLAGHIDLDKCFPGNLTWSYDLNLHTTRENIDVKLGTFYEIVERDKINRLSKMNSYFRRR